MTCDDASADFRELSNLNQIAASRGFQVIQRQPGSKGTYVEAI